MLVTTEKDVVRLLPFRPLPIPVAFLPMSISIDRQQEFDDWLAGVVTASRKAA